MELRCPSIRQPYASAILLGLESSDQPQRVEIVGQGVAGGPHVQANRRRDVRQHVIARQQHLVAGVIQADVAG